MTTLASRNVVVKNLTIDWDGPSENRPSIILEPEAPFPAYNVLAPDHFFVNRRSAIGVNYITEDFVDACSWDVDIHQSGPCFELKKPDGTIKHVIDEEMPIYSHMLNDLIGLKGDDRLVPIVYRQRTNLTIHGNYKHTKVFIRVGRLREMLAENLDADITVFLTNPVHNEAKWMMPLEATPSIASDYIAIPTGFKAFPECVIVEKL